MSDSRRKKCFCLQKIENLKEFEIASLNIDSLLRDVDELGLMLPNFEIDIFAW